MADRPNILIITTHDTGRHFGCYGVETVHTPAVDTLSADGLRFTNHFAASTLCSPSRCAMLTGRYPQSNGVMGLTHSPWHWSLNEGERHLSHLVKDAGYHTALFGLQHETQDPDSLGFDTQVGGPKPGIGRPPASEVAELVSDFLRGEAAGRSPFYAQVGFFETHRRFDFGGATPDDSKGVTVPSYLMENDASVKDLAEFQGAIRSADAAVGLISDALSETGLDRNTIFIFTVDHGIPFPRAKTFLYEPGIEVAFVVRWPEGGAVGGKTYQGLTSHVDVVPTLLSAIGTPVPETVQGVSFFDAFAESEFRSRRDSIYGAMHRHSEANELRCVRTRDHKLIRNFAPRRLLDVPVDMTAPSKRVDCPVAQLFDLERDPGELENLAEDEAYSDVYRALSDNLWGWMEAVEDPLLSGPVPSPYYHQAMADYGRGSRV